MSWDLGPEGLALLALISLGFGVAGGLLVGGDRRHHLIGAAVTTVACFVAGLVTSEWVFGWATEEELQPNVDGLSRDEVLLSSLLVTVVAVLVMRLLARRPTSGSAGGGRGRSLPGDDGGRAPRPG